MAIITVSRGTFSGGLRLATCISEKLGYRCISREEIVAEAARQYGVQEKKLYQVLMKKPGVLERAVGNTTERLRYLSCVRAALCKEAHDDNIVYHGNAGHMLLNGANNLIKVRVIAGMEYRITAVMERLHLNREEALELIHKTDQERAKWTMFLYHIDWKAPSLYDLIINLDHVNITGACDIVCHMAGMKKYKTSSETRKALDDLVLSSNVKAKIAIHKEISDGNISIDADGSTITIFGTVGSIFDADRVRMIAREVPGVGEINSKMRIHLPSFIAN
jgi:cytidylate kinase